MSMLFEHLLKASLTSLQWFARKITLYYVEHIELIQASAACPTLFLYSNHNHYPHSLCCCRNFPFYVCHVVIYMHKFSDEFTGFVFKLQANLDPRHRDRMAFIRVCSGIYHTVLNGVILFQNTLFFVVPCHITPHAL